MYWMDVFSVVPLIQITYLHCMEHYININRTKDTETMASNL